ncbi:MAG: glycosyltransferase family 39 protein [Candidatus Sumerlaeaceae bacterium]|nr:glycosyltransferase family 39 protein [Candidatus Sumerlaeaceae bacterium]
MTIAGEGEARRRALLALAGATVLGVGLRAAVAAPLELFADEALYLWLARQMPFGFCPHPPGVPLMVRLGISLLGPSEWGVRLVHQSVALLLPAAVFLLARCVGDWAAAARAAWAAACVPAFVVGGAMATPDAPQLVLWALIAAAVWHACQTGRRRWWAAAGVLLGGAMLIKYIVILVLPAVVLFLLLRPEVRRLSGWRGPWVMAAVAAALFAPPALWSEWQAGWPTLRYHLVERQMWRVPSPGPVLQYVGIHLLVYSPLLYALLLWGLVEVARRMRRREEGPRAAFLFAFAVVPIALFLAVAAMTDRRTGREHWDAPGCLMLLVVLAVQFGATRVRRRLLAGAVALAAVASVVTVAEAHARVVSSLLGREPLFSNMSGWRDLAAAIDCEAGSLPGGAERVVVTNRFEPAMQYLAYSSAPGGARPVKVLDHHSARDHGVRHLLVAGRLEQHRLMDHPGASAVFVIERPRDAGETGGDQARREAKLRRLFQSVVRGPDSGRFALYRCTGLRYPPEE